MKKEKINEKVSDENREFIDRTNRALKRIYKFDMKGLSKEEFLHDLKSW